VYTRSWFGIVSHILCGLYCVEVLTTWTLDFDECRYSRVDTVVECRCSRVDTVVECRYSRVDTVVECRYS